MKFFLPPLIRRTVRARFLGNFVLLFGLLFLLGTSIDTLLTFHEYLEVTSGEGCNGLFRPSALWLTSNCLDCSSCMHRCGPRSGGGGGFTFVRMQRHREIVDCRPQGFPPFVDASDRRGHVDFDRPPRIEPEFMVPKLAPMLARTHGDIGQDAIRAFAVPPTPDGSGRLWCSGTCDPVRGTMADVLV